MSQHSADAGDQPLRSRHRADERPRAGRGRRSHAAQPADRGNLLPHVQPSRLRCVRSLDGQVLLAGLAGQFAVRRHSGVPIAGVPAFLDLHPQGRQREAAVRPQGQAGRHSGMGADRVGLFARAAAAPVRRRSDIDRMGAGRRRSAGPAGEGEAQSAGRAQVLVRGRQELERDAGVGRDRCRAVGASAGRASSRAIPTSR